ncbi:MAG: hypothetical protein ABIF18_01090 [archaeon]
MAKKKIKKTKVSKNPWFRKRVGYPKDTWGFIPINCKGWVALLLLVGINVFSVSYFNLNELVFDSWSGFLVVFLLSLLVFILIAKKKTK